MLAPVRAVKNTAPLLLVAGLGIALLTNFWIGILAVVGVVLSTVAALGDNKAPVTKRRAVNGLWAMFGGHAAVMAVLCLVTMILAIVVAHQIVWWPIAFFTLLACWLPFVARMLRRKDR
ncbi:MAG: hypothetical protein JSS66_12165 [Armatimonadetes bacterium]|nr:hypothetical protein [Armatimonadota bacterium]